MIESEINILRQRVRSPASTLPSIAVAAPCSAPATDAPAECSPAASMTIQNMEAVAICPLHLPEGPLSCAMCPRSL